MRVGKLLPEGIRVGDTFGILTVLQFRGRNKASQAIFDVQCECGSVTAVLGTNLKKRNTTKCNAGSHRAKHGMTLTPEYQAWKAMNWRVKAKHPHLRTHYRDKGITVCEEWRSSFKAFLSHIGMMPGPGMEVDRRNSDGNYEPGNVRWATRTQQMRNTKVNRLLTVNGETKSVTEWAESVGIPPQTLFYRLNRQWPESDILSTERWPKRRDRCA